MYEGVIIKETLSDELLLDYLTIDKVEICKTNNAIKYWTLVTFHSETEDLPQRLAAVIIEGWFADMKSGNVKFIIFKDKVLKYEIGNALEIEEVVNYMRSRGIPEGQIKGSISWGV
jgi:hypothetical protein